MVLVTDIKRINNQGKEVTGFYIDGFLYDNLERIVPFLNKDWIVLVLFLDMGK